MNFSLILLCAAYQIKFSEGKDVLFDIHEQIYATSEGRYGGCLWSWCTHWLLLFGDSVCWHWWNGSRGDKPVFAQSWRTCYVVADALHGYGSARPAFFQDPMSAKQRLILWTKHFWVCLSSLQYDLFANRGRPSCANLVNYFLAQVQPSLLQVCLTF